MNIERAVDAKRVNEIVNDPSVFPWIKGDRTEPFDLTDIVNSPHCVVLVAEYACVIFAKIQPGIYEFHASVLPEWRGSWMKEGAAKVFHWMFTKTDAYELLTKCPDGNVLAKAGARSVGCTMNFRTGDIWPANGKKIPVDVYGMLIQHWVREAPGLEETGRWFHENLTKQYKQLNFSKEAHSDDDTHDRYVGAAIEMIRGGQVMKAVNFYNRWAAMAGYRTISVVSSNPLVIDIYEAKIRVSDNNFEVM